MIELLEKEAIVNGIIINLWSDHISISVELRLRVIGDAALIFINLLLHIKVLERLFFAANDN